MGIVTWSVQICGWFSAATVRASRWNRCFRSGSRRDVLGQHLDGDGAVEARVGGLIDLAHTALADEGRDVVVGEVFTDVEGWAPLGCGRDS